MTDLLSLLLGQASQEAEESPAGALDAALQVQAVLSAAQGAPLTEEEPKASSSGTPLTEAEPKAGSSGAPAPRLAAEYAALRRTVSGLDRAAGTVGSWVAPPSETVTLTQPFRQTAQVGPGVLPGQRLVIKEAESSVSLSPSDLDRLFERDARRYDNGFTLY